MFPIGGQYLAGWGPSWYVGVLPYMDGGTIFKRFTFAGTSPGWTHQTVNRNLVRNLTIPWMLCPSSPLPQTADSGNALGNDRTQYVGISGAADGNGFTAQRQWNCCTCCGGNASNGKVSGDGMIVLNTAIRLRDATDGSTNTMMIGETSNWAKDGNDINHHIEAGYPHGWLMGAGNPGQITSRSSSKHERPFNLTTIMYPPGTTNYNLPGVFDNHGSNNPLLSAHVGGFQTVLGDGSARFISNNINMLTLKRLRPAMTARSSDNSNNPLEFPHFFLCDFEMVFLCSTFAQAHGISP